MHEGLSQQLSLRLTYYGQPLLPISAAHQEEHQDPTVVLHLSAVWQKECCVLSQRLKLPSDGLVAVWQYLRSSSITTLAAEVSSSRAISQAHVVENSYNITYFQLTL